MRAVSSFKANIDASVLKQVTNVKSEKQHCPYKNSVKYKNT